MNTPTKENLVSRLRPSQTTTMTFHRPTFDNTQNSRSTSADRVTGETPDAVVATGITAATSAHTRYSATTAALVVAALHDLERIDDVVTISAIARRIGLSRPTVRAVLQQECGWTIVQSRRAHYAGVRRGKLVQAVEGYPGLTHGRASLRAQGWPNLQRAQRAAQAGAYPALQRGRETQATHGWPSLKAAHESLSTKGYPHLAQGRANLAARGWPNWQRAQDVLKAQDYLPLLEARRCRRDEDAALQPHQTRQTNAETDRRRMRGRDTRMAILEALHSCQACSAADDRRAPNPPGAGTSVCRLSARALAAQLRLHPSTVYAHLKQVRLLTDQELMAESS